MRSRGSAASNGPAVLGGMGGGARLIGAVVLLLVVSGILWSRSRSASPGTGEVQVDVPEGFYLREVGESSGVTIRTICGSPKDKKFIIETNGSGAALFDYDLDGDLDLYVINGSTIEILREDAPAVRNALYRNDGEWRFTDVTESAGVGDTGWGYGCAVGDIDNDGDPDLYVTNFGPNTLYENLGDGTFREVGSKRGVADGGWGHSAAFGDIDSDGDLDLYVTNKIVFDIDRPPNEGRPCLYRGLPGMCGPLGLTPQADRLYRNDGRGAFEDVSESSGIAAPPPSYGLGVIFGDYDDDGRVDIYVANDSLPNFLFHNLGDGKFDEVAGTAGVAVKGDGIPQAGMGVDFGDFDGDLRPDIFVTNFSQDYYTLYWNAGEGLFVDVAAGSALENATRTVLGWGTRFLDVDNDGDQDLYAANGHVYPDIGSLDLGSTYWEPDQLFLNMGGSEFREASERIRLSGPPRCSRGAAFGDIDNDGDIDVVVVEMADRPTLLENVGGNKGNWIRIVLRGHESNRHGMGARVWVTAMEKTQRREATRGGSYCSSSDPRVHVGLGKADRVERIRVIWPSGKEQGFSDLEVNREIVIDEDAGIVRRQEERR